MENRKRAIETGVVEDRQSCMNSTELCSCETGMYGLINFFGVILFLAIAEQAVTMVKDVSCASRFQAIVDYVTTVLSIESMV
jgi:hypothetical protein